MQFLLSTSMLFVVLVGTQACGSPSQAALDCEEYNRFVAHVRADLRDAADAAAFTTLEPEACAAWVESTATRCQQVFYELAVCSRRHHSRPNISAAECVSEYLEVAGACVLPDDFDS